MEVVNEHGHIDACGGGAGPGYEPCVKLPESICLKELTFRSNDARHAQKVPSPRFSPTPTATDQQYGRPLPSCASTGDHTLASSYGCSDRVVWCMVAVMVQCGGICRWCRRLRSCAVQCQRTRGRRPRGRPSSPSSASSSPRSAVLPPYLCALTARGPWGTIPYPTHVVSHMRHEDACGSLLRKHLR